MQSKNCQQSFLVMMLRNTQRHQFVNRFEGTELKKVTKAPICQQHSSTKSQYPGDKDHSFERTQLKDIHKVFICQQHWSH